MSELLQARPRVDVAPDEYKRLLGFPRGWVFDERSAELAAAARAWYAEHGQPWVYAYRAERLEIADDTIRIDGVPFHSPRLQATLVEADANSAILVAVSAGGELEREAQRLWLDGKPDEYFFFEVYGSAVVEHLVTMKGAELCAWAETHDEAVLPHYSPGYPEWDIAEQPRLLDLICRGGDQSLPGELEVLDSGMLRPKKSLLAVFGLTRHRDRVGRLTELNPCGGCSFAPCQYRRAPYQKTARAAASDEVVRAKQLIEQLLPPVVPVEATVAGYSTSTKALARWAAERLALTRRENGMIEALFRYEGSTCNNMGQPLLFDYHVTLSPRDMGHIIRSMDCRPATGDTGHKAMCRYVENPSKLMSSIKCEEPLLGEPLESVLAWNAARSSAGCYCDLAARMHKWRLVLETIHYALAEQIQQSAAANNGRRNLP